MAGLDDGLCLSFRSLCTLLQETTEQPEGERGSVQCFWKHRHATHTVVAARTGGIPGTSEEEEDGGWLIAQDQTCGGVGRITHRTGEWSFAFSGRGARRERACGA